MDTLNQATVEQLKAELDKAWRIVDGAHEKENRARETIQKLKGEIVNLTELIESGKSANATQTEEERRAREAKEAELMTASELNEEVVTLRSVFSPKIVLIFFSRTVIDSLDLILAS